MNSDMDDIDDVAEDARVPNPKLRRARELRGWSRKTVALEMIKRWPDVAVTEKYVARWESGKRKPGSYYKEKLCAIFGLNAVDLGFLEPEPTVRELSENQRVITFTHEQAKQEEDVSRATSNSIMMLKEDQVANGQMMRLDLSSQEFAALSE